MASVLGSATTSNFIIGSFELRVGPLDLAGRLTDHHSVGLVDSFNLNTQVNKTELKASYPRRIVDTAITSSVSGFSAELKEFSRRNLKMLFGQGADSEIAADEVLKYEGVSLSALVKDDDARIIFTDAAVVTGSGKAYSVSKTVTTIKTTGSTVVNKPADPTISSVLGYGTSPGVFTSDITGVADSSVTSGTGAAATTTTTTTHFIEEYQYVGSISKPYSEESTYTVTITKPKGFVVVFSSGSNERIIKAGSHKKNVTTYTMDSDSTTTTTFIVSRDANYPNYFSGKVKVTSPTNASGSVTITIKETNKQFEAGDFVVLSDSNNSAVTFLTTVVAHTTASLILKNDRRTFPVSTYNIAPADPMGFGVIDASNRYFTASLLQLDRASGSPLIYDFWKCSLESGMDMSVNIGQFASLPLKVKVLRPTARDVGETGALYSARSAIDLAPTWRYTSSPLTR